MGKEIILKCDNDLTVNITKDSGEVILDEKCCTELGILLKNNGEIVTTFLGVHNPEICKILEKSLKSYFKSLRRTLKRKYKDETEPFENENIVVHNVDIPEDKKWNDSAEIPSKKESEKSPKSSEKVKTKKDTIAKEKAHKKSPKNNGEIVK